MKDKQKICGAIYRRYQRAGKAAKGKLPDEYAETLALNRDYLAHILSNRGKTRYGTIDGRPVKIIAKPAGMREKTHKTGRKPKYQSPQFKALLISIREQFDYRCGKLFAPMIPPMIDFLAAEYRLDDTLRTMLMDISPAAIDRILQPEKDRYRLKGISLSKPGSLLKNQIPIRVFFTWDERTPGFFEVDHVSHCGAHAQGEFCQTLTMTDAASGWTEETALLNSARRWVKEGAAAVRAGLPYPMKGIDSDNGGEFINHQPVDWCAHNAITFTRGRPYHKNDNCFVEQKNGGIVRKTVGYRRFEGSAMHAALQSVYCCLNPPVNYWYPTFRLIAKEKQASGRYKKIYEKEPKTPCQRLLESPDVGGECKTELRRRTALLNPAALKREMDKARDCLLKLAAKADIPVPAA